MLSKSTKKTGNDGNEVSPSVCCQTEERHGEAKVVQNDDKSSVITIVCRICYDGDKDEPIIAPCCCKGTVAYVHRSCLETWLAESNTTTCELCHHIFNTERTPKYTVRRSIWRWVRRGTPNLGFEVRGIRGDFIACALLTPLAIAITYICLFSADYYNQQRFAHIPAARWTSVSLLMMVVIMLIGYYMWAYMAIKYHSRVWYYWWQRECVVRLPSRELFLRDDHNNDYNNFGNNQNSRRDSIVVSEEYFEESPRVEMHQNSAGVDANTNGDNENPEAQNLASGSNQENQKKSSAKEELNKVKIHRIPANMLGSAMNSFTVCFVNEKVPKIVPQMNNLK